MLSLLLFLSLIHSPASTTDEVRFYQGMLVLQGGEVWVGSIGIRAYEVVIFKNGDQTFVLPAHRLSMVRFYDATENINRKMVVARSGLSSPLMLYEEVVSGEVEVLRRPRDLPGKVAFADHNAFDYFALVHGELILLQKFKGYIYPVLHEQAGRQMESFIAQNKLSINVMADAIRIITFYNQHMRNLHTGLVGMR